MPELSRQTHHPRTPRLVGWRKVCLMTGGLSGDDISAVSSIITSRAAEKKAEPVLQIIESFHAPSVGSHGP
jgi:hypothetical protein